jgi:hypothetical protein
MDAVNSLDINASRTEYINVLRQISEENLDALEDQIIQMTGIDPAYVRTISADEMNKTIGRFQKKGWDPRDIPGVTTARIYVDEGDLNLYFEKIKGEFKVVKEYPEKPENKGQVAVDVRLPSGTIAQIQIYAKSPQMPQEITDEIALETGNKMGSTYALVLEGKTTDEVIDNLIVSDNAAQLTKNKGMDVSGWTYTVEPDFYEHTRNKHGPGREWRKGQEAITEEDVKWVPEIMRNPDNVQLGTTEEGENSITFIKRIDGTIYYVQIVGADKKQLVAKTMWKFKR